MAQQVGVGSILRLLTCFLKNPNFLSSPVLDVLHGLSQTQKQSGEVIELVRGRTSGDHVVQSPHVTDEKTEVQKGDGGA